MLFKHILFLKLLQKTTLQLILKKNQLQYLPFSTVLQSRIHRPKIINKMFNYLLFLLPDLCKLIQEQDLGISF